MKKKIFLSLIGIGIGAALLTLLFLTVGFWRTLRAQTMTVLQDTVTVIAAKANRTDDIIEFIEETAEASNHRLRFTWIGHDGRVLYETDHNAAQMENHGNRPEVVRALKEVDGVAARQSLPWTTLRTMRRGVCPTDRSCEQPFARIRFTRPISVSFLIS